MPKFRLILPDGFSWRLTGSTVSEPVMYLHDDGRVWRTRATHPLVTGNSERENEFGHDPPLWPG